jgi:hypothetical protein
MYKNFCKGRNLFLINYYSCGVFIKNLLINTGCHLNTPLNSSEGYFYQSFYSFKFLVVLAKNIYDTPSQQAPIHH